MGCLSSVEPQYREFAEAIAKAAGEDSPITRGEWTSSPYCSMDMLGHYDGIILVGPQSGLFRDDSFFHESAADRFNRFLSAAEEAGKPVSLVLCEEGQIYPLGARSRLETNIRVMGRDEQSARTVASVIDTAFQRRIYRNAQRQPEVVTTPVTLKKGYFSGFFSWVGGLIKRRN